MRLNPFMSLVDPATAIGVARGNNRVNSQGLPQLNQTAKTSLFVQNTVAAGDTLPVSCSGTQFYVTVATAAISVRPSGGVFNSYTQGTGLNLLPENAFSLLEIKNENAFPIVFQIFIGFDGFIDNRLILNTATGQTTVAYPTYPVANAAAVINILDKSGQVITDVNGGSWYALNRNDIFIYNADAAAVYSLQGTAAAVAADPSVGLIQPLTSIRLPYQGNFKIIQGGNINAIVSETYQAIPKV